MHMKPQIQYNMQQMNKMPTSISQTQLDNHLN